MHANSSVHSTQKIISSEIVDVKRHLYFVAYLFDKAAILVMKLHVNFDAHLKHQNLECSLLVLPC